MGLVDQIVTRARGYSPRRAIIATVTLPLWAVGYVLGVVVRALWTVGTLIVAAAGAGYDTGRKR